MKNIEIIKQSLKNYKNIEKKLAFIEDTLINFDNTYQEIKKTSFDFEKVQGGINKIDFIDKKENRRENLIVKKLEYQELLNKVDYSLLFIDNDIDLNILKLHFIEKETIDNLAFKLSVSKQTIVNKILKSLKKIELHLILHYYEIFKKVKLSDFEIVLNYIRKKLVSS